MFARFGAREPGTPEARMEEHMTSIGADPVALLHVLDTSVDTPIPAIISARFSVPISGGRRCFLAGPELA